MNIQFLDQGYGLKSPNSVGQTLIDLLACRDYSVFTAISAFASVGGVQGLKTCIEQNGQHLRNVRIVVGVDQKGTSKEALDLLLQLNADVFVFYQPAMTIFHPKIYLFEGERETKLIVGSSNLTAQGLFANIEASLLVSIDNNNEEELDVVEQLKSRYSGIFDGRDPNLQPLTRELIDHLVELTIVPTEVDRRLFQDKVVDTNGVSHNPVLSVFPRRVQSPIHPSFRKRNRGIQRVRRQSQETIPQMPLAKDTDQELLWISRPLTERDLNIPTGSTTHPTGSMLLKKGDISDIDQRHYFRETVFADEDWERDPKRPKYERVMVPFYFQTNGEVSGPYSLKISHNNDTESKSYLQKNSMTSISWGDAKEIIAKCEFLGKKAVLYRIPGAYMLAIE